MKHEGASGTSRAVGIAMVVMGAWACASRADVIVLRGGGEIQGKVIVDPKKPGIVEILLMKGRNRLVFQRQQILEVVPKASPLDDYLVKKSKIAANPSAAAELELGQWCEQNQLPDLARLHYEAAVQHDSSLQAAHKKLGHVQLREQWLSPDEIRQAQGLIKYRGRWITEDEKAKLDETAAASAAQASWLRRVKLLRQALLSSTTDRRREAEAELMQIREPVAVAPLMKVLSHDAAPLRMVLAHVLGEIPGSESSRALVSMILVEPEEEVCGALLQQLRQRDEPGIVPQLIKALRSENVKVINRAAWTLGNLEAITAVPQLTRALVTTEEQIVLVSEADLHGSLPGNGLGPALMGTSGNWAACLTPPTVAPNVVAYGAASVPLTPSQLIGGGGGFFGLIASPSRQPQLRVVTMTYQNVEVLAALEKLTGQEFGYDVDAWRRWIKDSFNPYPTPVRQVPQP
jgi:hypothetical protein